LLRGQQNARGIIPAGSQHRNCLNQAVDQVVSQERARQQQKLHAMLQRLQTLHTAFQPLRVCRPLRMVSVKQTAEFWGAAWHGD
jgi:hypothetical protein